MILATLLVALLPNPTPGPGGPYGDGHARLRLLSEETSLVPGDTLHLGVSFEIEPGWHLYWNGRNDTGLPISVELRLPEGYTAGDILWPAPERHLSPGNILDHVYHDEVTLIVPVAVPQDATPGRAVRISALVNWLVCKDVCLPAHAEVSVTVPPRRPDPDAAPRFEAARSRLPRPLPPDAGIRLRWEGTTLRVDAPTARALAFFPFLQCAKLSHPIEDGASPSGSLALRVAPADTGESPAVSGVLEVEAPAGPTFYIVREAVPAP